VEVPQKEFAMKNDATNVRVMRPRPKELNSSGDASPFLPTQQEFAKFVLPKRLDINKLHKIADTVSLADLGITVPHGRRSDRFEAGFRYGLAHNARTDGQTQFNYSFSHGFCFAKCFYRKFSPGSRLAAAGSARFKITAKE
jgi:hypothetical protein